MKLNKDEHIEKQLCGCLACKARVHMFIDYIDKFAAVYAAERIVKDAQS